MEKHDDIKESSPKIYYIITSSFSLCNIMITYQLEELKVRLFFHDTILFNKMANKSKRIPRWLFNLAAP